MMKKILLVAIAVIFCSTLALTGCNQKKINELNAKCEQLAKEKAELQAAADQKAALETELQGEKAQKAAVDEKIDAIKKIVSGKAAPAKKLAEIDKLVK